MAIYAWSLQPSNLNTSFDFTRCINSFFNMAPLESDMVKSFVYSFQTLRNIIKYTEKENQLVIKN